MQRRLLTVLALLAGLAPAAAIKSSGEGAPADLGIMAASQTKLTMAQVVKETRKQVESLLVQEGRQLGEAIGRYVGELGEASRYLQAAINASQAQVASSNAAASAGAGPETKARSKLSADIGQAKRMQRQIEKRQDHAVHSAATWDLLEEFSPMDDRSQLVFSTLERKLGDLSPLVEAAKRELEAGGSGARYFWPNTTAHVTIAGNSSTASSLRAASGALTAATKRSKSEVVAANIRLDTTMSQIMEQVTNNATAIEASMERAEQVVNNATAIEASMERAEEKEVRRLRGGGGAQVAPSESINLV